jgi:transposase
MAYKNGNRNQYNLFPTSIEEYVSTNDSVRAYDAFVEALNFNELGIDLNDNKVGNSEYNPKVMIKLLIYGPSYGVRSSRKLERACYHNVSFIWLMGGLKPDHKTISNFRKKNRKSITKILKQCVRMCVNLDLIEGNILFVDGTKIRGNAGIKNTWDKKKCEKHLKIIDANIEELMKECSELDQEEENQTSLVNMKEELNDKAKLKEKIEKIVKELNTSKKKKINSTDFEAVNYKSREGFHSGYNGQCVVDEKNGLVVNTDVVNDNNDRNQFANQINKANVNLGKQCESAVADSGYSNTEDLKKIDKQKIKVIVPSQKQSQKNGISKFDKTNFTYDKDRDCYICPKENILKYVSNDNTKNTKVYRIEKQSLCQSCEYFEKCTTNKKGRHLHRNKDEESMKKFEEQYLKEESQKIYALRKQKAELPFGFIKRNINFRAFLLRGLGGVRSEFGIAATIFNVTRMINLLGGVEGFIKTIQT